MTTDPDGRLPPPVLDQDLPAELQAAPGEAVSMTAAASPSLSVVWQSSSPSRSGPWTSLSPASPDYSISGTPERSTLSFPAISSSWDGVQLRAVFRTAPDAITPSSPLTLRVAAPPASNGGLIAGLVVGLILLLLLLILIIYCCIRRKRREQAFGAASKGLTDNQFYQTEVGLDVMRRPEGVRPVTEFMAGDYYDDPYEGPAGSSDNRRRTYSSDDDDDDDILGGSVRPYE